MRHTTVTLAAFFVGLLSASYAYACSRVLWDSGNGQVFVGRTQDWTERADSGLPDVPARDRTARRGGRESPQVDFEIWQPGPVGLRRGHA